MISGIINVYKEVDFTSHDVVAKLRGILREKKIGHTGTLDPKATGVLPVCVGKATKLCELLADHDKEYKAEIIFGLYTDTEDIHGEVLIRKDPLEVTQYIHEYFEEIEQDILSFAGDYAQIPPMYSALKVDGKKLYEYARKGINIEREARNVHIYSITIDKWEFNDNDYPRAFITVKCSKGTYIRSLCRDIGSKVTTGACMGALVRTEVGAFRLVDALKLSDIEALEDRASCILPMDEMLSDYPVITVKNEFLKKALNGNKLEEDEVILSDQKGKGLFRLYSEDRELMALYKRSGKEFKPYKMLLS